jgi:Tfp pilus assembly protein PilP
MKSLISLTLLLAGCATQQDLTFEQRMELVRTIQQTQYHPLPQPTPMYVPQTRVITCTRSDGSTYACQ